MLTFDMKLNPSIGIITLGLAAALVGSACSAGPGNGKDGDSDGGDGDGGDGDGDGNNGDGDGDLNVGDGDGDGIDEDNPANCAVAAENRTYVGCEFWPTITYNPVYTEFDFAVVLANGGTQTATITVSGGAGAVPGVDIPPGELRTIILPWQMTLKGPEFDRVNTSGGRANASALVPGGAYKIVSSSPVTAWQFNPLQYKKPTAGSFPLGCGTEFVSGECYSASNDASLLVPTAAMTKSYRVFTRSGAVGGGDYLDAAGGVAVTATGDTTVVIQLGPNCAAGSNNPPGSCLVAGSGVAGGVAGDVLEIPMKEGDVLQLIGAQGQDEGVPNHADLSGSLIQSEGAPIQVIAFNPITNMPNPMTGNADHIEELVLPAEVIGKEYLVAPPSNPSGVVLGGHIVRIYGNVDGTGLTYEGTAPAGAPATINAGAVVELGPVAAGFKIIGTEPFAVGSFMLGGSAQGSNPTCPDYPCSGDPAFSMMVTPQQFRSSYTFLAPIDYDTNFADVLIPDSATSVTIDGVAVTANEVVSPGWKVARVALGPGAGGAHTLVADAQVGLQVMGFGHATAYYYPGGLNLKIISTPPPVIVK